MGVAYQKGMLLFRQRRWRGAIEQFQAELATDPTSAGTFSMLALAFVNDQQIEPAFAAARESIQLNPQHAQGHWAMAHVLLRRREKLRWFQYNSGGRQGEQRRRLTAAKAALLEAIRLHPYDANFYELLAAIEGDLRQWQASLEAVERGLAVNPQHVGCANRRALLLNHLGRVGEARSEIDRALRIDPEHALTH